MVDPNVPLRVASANVHSKIFDDEVVVLDMRAGTYFSLRGSGVDVWELIEANATGARISETLAARYDAPPAEITRAAEVVLDELAEAGLIVSDASVEAAGASSQAGVKSPFPAPEIERFTDMQEMLQLDPIHEVDEAGWPHTSTAQ
jgi:Coenzyme PQQ synthesis protein D (PqqD)